jgi:threonine synthase
MTALVERYRERLSLEPDDPVVSLQEGSTPLIEAPRLAERIGARTLLKFEGANPTGSFKDRGMTVAVSRAKGRGAEAVICASTGNTAASAAAYAARAGLRGAVIVPEGKIAKVLGDNEISVKSVVQRGIGDDARLVMVVHECLESSFSAAVEQIAELDELRSAPRFIRVIEEEYV